MSGMDAAEGLNAARNFAGLQLSRGVAGRSRGALMVLAGGAFSASEVWHGPGPKVRLWLTEYRGGDVGKLDCAAIGRDGTGG